MLEKMRPRRRAALLKALDASGNVTLAAERACVPAQGELFGASTRWMLTVT